jgi:hypothetical protein
VSRTLRALLAAAFSLVPAACLSSPPPESPCLGCRVAIATAAGPSEACVLMPIAGVLVYDPPNGMSLLKADGTVRRVLWPFGWSAWREEGGIVLRNRSGEGRGTEGARVQYAGGVTRDYDFICDEAGDLGPS